MQRFFQLIDRALNRAAEQKGQVGEAAQRSERKEIKEGAAAAVKGKERRGK
jgi:hypothetical protein